MICFLPEAPAALPFLAILSSCWSPSLVHPKSGFWPTPSSSYPPNSSPPQPLNAPLHAHTYALERVPSVRTCTDPHRLASHTLVEEAMWSGPHLSPGCITSAKLIPSHPASVFISKWRERPFELYLQLKWKYFNLMGLMWIYVLYGLLNLFWRVKWLFFLFCL